MKELDLSGLACPQPVIKTKEALEKDDNIVVIVDNEVAFGNVKRLVKKLGYNLEVLEEKEGYYKMHIFKENEKDVTFKTSKKIDLVSETAESLVVFIKTETLGSGSSELGKILIRSFLYALGEMTNLPKKIALMNGGVKLATVDDESVERLKRLEEKGVEIMVCGTCLDYFNLKDQLKVGYISNMYDIVETLTEGEVISV